MQHVLGNTGETGATPRRPGLVSTIFREYRTLFSMFWRVMLPLIIVSLIFNITVFLFFKLAIWEAQWIFNTSQGVRVQSSSTFNGPSGNFQSTPEPTRVDSGVGFSASSLDIGLLWLAMCPLAFIIVHHRRGVDITYGEVWKHTLRKTLSILSGGVFLVALVQGVYLIVFSLILLIDEPSMIIVFLFVLVLSIPIAYFMVKWSLYNQGIIIENLSAVAAFRRSSELVRGTWSQFFGMYVLLILVTMVFTSAILGLTLLLFSVVSPTFAQLREILQSGKFFSLFFGGYVKITLQSAPVWAIGVMITVNTLIHAVLAPIWAILTTHLYMERVDISEQQMSG